MSSLVLGLVSGAAMFGAIQYASGNDLSGSSLRGTLTDRDTAISTASFALAVNRTAKGDRDTTPAKLDAGQTLSFQVHGLTDTSVLLRLAGAPKAQQDKPASTKAIPIDTKPRKATVACEPPVSMLTEVARSLQPGRCVT
ncbi:hypothetical protein [Tardiphaga sp.]|jgi:hypothetical protein|uniref:hypothetical protein n=1 Tax=Tardiphaga sp. TaxID=1926292 RepID=UPI0037D9FD4E